MPEFMLLDLYREREGSRGCIRQYDVETEHVTELRKWPNFDDARAFFEKHRKYAI